MKDGSLVETVLMRYIYGNAVCVSSQVGCNMGCSFCASGLLKKVRDLTPSEMVAEVMTVQLDLNKSNERVSHIVIMGIGEPFDNYDNVMQFIYCINEAKGLAIGARHISVSTSGLVPGIKKLMNEKIHVGLHRQLPEQKKNLTSLNESLFRLCRFGKIAGFFNRFNDSLIQLKLDTFSRDPNRITHSHRI